MANNVPFFLLPVPVTKNTQMRTIKQGTLRFYTSFFFVIVLKKKKKKTDTMNERFQMKIVPNVQTGNFQQFFWEGKSEKL